MSVLHRIAHFFGINYTFKDLYCKEDGSIWTCDRCGSCNVEIRPAKLSSYNYFKKS